jgi:N-acetylglucosamine-6-sulfatase
MPEGKDTAYEEDIRGPFAVRGPDVPRGERIEAMALSIYLAPTFAAWAGATQPDFVDGRSLVPFLRGATIPRRNSFLIERLGLESDEQHTDGNMLAIRTRKYTYATYHNGERELYDLEKDPYQVQNIEATADPALIEALNVRKNQLSVSQAEGCRDFEALPID